MECNELTSMLVQDEPIVKSQRANSVHFLSHQKAEKNYIYKKSGRSKKKGLHNLYESSKAVPKKEHMNV